jgi:hypothetical protein
MTAFLGRELLSHMFLFLTFSRIRNRGMSFIGVNIKNQIKIKFRFKFYLNNSYEFLANTQISTPYGQ